MTRTDSLTRLKSDALAIRRAFLKMHFEVQSGHIGSGLSAIDLLTYLHGSWLERGSGPAQPFRDRFVLSKGHAASSLYATLHHYGVLSDEQIKTYYRDGTYLAAHPVPNGFAGLQAATGSLGHGFPIAVGLAYSHRHLLNDGARVACLVSDGECNEGTIWEAALFAQHHRLDNLVVIVDANGLQGFGRTTEVLNMEPISDKWRAFGFQTLEIDGHDFTAIDNAFRTAGTAARPTCVVARTVKGKGVGFMEDRMEWHYLPMKPEHYEQAIKDLEAQVEAQSGVKNDAR